MKLADLQKLSTKELKELAAKEGVTPSGDKRSRITWLVALEMHFEQEEILSYQPKYHQVVQKENGEIHFRRSKPKGNWHKTTFGPVTVMRHIIDLEKSLDEMKMALALTQFRSFCVPVRQCTRPP